VLKEKEKQMKRLIILLAGVFFSFQLYAQQLSEEQLENMSRKERKEYKKQQKLKEQKELMETLNSKEWVLEAYMLQNRYGESINIQPSLNFVALNGDEATVQLGSSHMIGPNGVGGITLEGQIRQYEMNENDKPGSGAYLQIGISGASSGHLSMSVHASADGSASATVRDNFGNRLTYRGSIVPTEESIAYKGQVVY
jgi:hypothetical protein